MTGLGHDAFRRTAAAGVPSTHFLAPDLSFLPLPFDLWDGQGIRHRHSVARG